MLVNKLDLVLALRKIQIMKLSMKSKNLRIQKQKVNSAFGYNFTMAVIMKSLLTPKIALVQKKKPSYGRKNLSRRLETWNPFHFQKISPKQCWIF